MAKKLTKSQLSMLIRINRYQDDPHTSMTFWQLSDGDRRIARNLHRAGYVTEQTNDGYRRGLALSDAGRRALESEHHNA